MARKLGHKTVVGTLRDIIAESDELAKSGDTRLAGEGRRTTLLAGVLLQIVSGISEDEFNSVKLANYKAKDIEKDNENLENEDNNFVA